MNKNNSVTVTLPDNGMCALVKKIDGRYEIDTGRIKGKDIFLSPWVKTADRLPTKADAGVDEEIVTIYDDGETRIMGADYWAYVAKVPERFPYWLPVPKLPEVEK